MPTRVTPARIDTEIFPHLEARAKKAEITVSEFIRQAVYEKLGETEDAAIRQEIENLKEEVATLREELGEAARAILIVAGSKEPYPKEKADAWARRELKLKPRPELRLSEGGAD